ncbi:MAG: hypothetical protein P8018_12500 [Acidobacteriota bacterium]
MQENPQGGLALDFALPSVSTLGELMSRALRVYRDNFKAIFTILFIVFVPLDLLEQYYAASLGPSTRIHPQQLFVLMLFKGLFGSLTVPAIVYVIIHRYRTDASTTLGSAFRWGVRQWPRVFFNRLLAGILILGGLFFFIVPGIVLAVSLVFTDMVVTIEGDRQDHVLTRSWNLSGGKRWFLFSAWLAGELLILSSSLFLAVLVQPLHNWIAAAGADFMSYLVAQIWTVMVLVLYLSFTGLERSREAALLEEAKHWPGSEGD